MPLSTRTVRLPFAALILACFGPLAGASDASKLAATSNGDGLEFFEKKIRPLLVERCYECHSAQSKKLKGGLRLDSRDGLLKGGDSGPVGIPCLPEKRLIFKQFRFSS